ncbi:MAG TPA: zf-HC2 domain-containing protein [Candidatus Dormibacteraeota bacterium]|nr:zf-HC2 domain-containing protein [Candidatus Dormibacteraeota bacterium]
MRRACRAAQAALPLRYYGALAAVEGATLARHLASCAGCAEEWETLRRALDAAGPSSVFPRESEVDWDRFARGAVARARAPASREAVTPRATGRRPRLLARPIPAAGIWAGLAAAALVVATLWTLSLPPRRRVGRGGPQVAPGRLEAESARESARAIEDRLARRSAARYLSDSRALLLSLVQPSRCRKPGGDLDMSLEAERSRQLLRRKNLYEGDLDGLRDQRLAALLRQLEPVLMQVASLQDCAPAGEIRELRDQIEQRQILLRIDLVTRDLQRRLDVV